MSHVDVLRALEPVAEGMLEDLRANATDKATSVSPILGTVVSAVLSEIVTIDNVRAIVDRLHLALVNLFGDDYPTHVSAEKIVWEDDR